MSGVTTGSGSKIYISATLPTTNNKTGYDALTWIKIGKVSNIGEYGSTYETVNFTDIESRVTEQLKGNMSLGNLPLTLGSLPADAGQVKLLEALSSDNNYAFKVDRKDGVIDAFQGKVMSFKPTVQGGAVLSINANITLQTEPIDIV